MPLEANPDGGQAEHIMGLQENGDPYSNGAVAIGVVDTPWESPAYLEAPAATASSQPRAKANRKKAA